MNLVLRRLKLGPLLRICETCVVCGFLLPGALCVSLLSLTLKASLARDGTWDALIPELSGFMSTLLSLASFENIMSQADWPVNKSMVHSKN